MAEGTGEQFDNSKLDLYKESVLSKAKPYVRNVKIVDTESDFSTIIKGVGFDGIYEMANIVSEHISLAATGFSDPENVSIEAHKLDKHSSSMLIKVFRLDDNEAKPVELLKIDPSAQGVLIASQRDDKEMISFVKAIAESGFTLPKRKWRPKE